jgi:hypothetical protein
LPARLTTEVKRGFERGAGSRTKGYLVRHSSAADSLLFFSARLLPVRCYSLAVGCTTANTSKKIAAHGSQNVFQVQDLRDQFNGVGGFDTLNCGFHMPEF